MGGYDSILSLPYLLNLDPNLTFKPVVKDGELMALEVIKGTTRILSIKDSIRIIPGSLSKLAKDYKVPTQKDHFPHYFFLNSVKETLNYKGKMPDYTCFEPKRTSKADYDVMVEEFLNKQWSFLEVSRQYIMGDCIALYQILLSFFSTLNDQFPINPLQVLSAPSSAFKIWRATQLPLLHQDRLSVFDFSNTNFDTYFRQGYNGLLSIKHQGKLICPAVIFRGLFFSKRGELLLRLN